MLLSFIHWVCIRKVNLLLSIIACLFRAHSVIPIMETGVLSRGAEQKKTRIVANEQQMGSDMHILILVSCMKASDTPFSISCLNFFSVINRWRNRSKWLTLTNDSKVPVIAGSRISETAENPIWFSLNWILRFFICGSKFITVSNMPYTVISSFVVSCGNNNEMGMNIRAFCLGFSC